MRARWYSAAPPGLFAPSPCLGVASRRLARRGLRLSCFWLFAASPCLRVSSRRLAPRTPSAAAPPGRPRPRQERPEGRRASRRAFARKRRGATLAQKLGTAVAKKLETRKSRQNLGERSTCLCVYAFCAGVELAPICPELWAAYFCVSYVGCVLWCLRPRLPVWAPIAVYHGYGAEYGARRGQMGQI